MPRTSRQIPLAAWIASSNPALRARAETALYHFGPDAGEALYCAADSISRMIAVKRALFTQPLVLLATSTMWWIVISLVCSSNPDERVTFINVALCINFVQTFLRLAWRIVGDLYWRRKRLKILALSLVKRDDLRGVGPLLEAWRPLSASGRQLRDEEVELELTRILPAFLAQQSIDLRSYRKRILRRKVARLFPYNFVRRRVESPGQFSETRSDLIVTLIQLLARYGSEADSALIERISRLSTGDGDPSLERNSVFIRDAALAYQTFEPHTDEPTPSNLMPRATTISASNSTTIQAVAKRS